MTTEPHQEGDTTMSTTPDPFPWDDAFGTPDPTPEPTPQPTEAEQIEAARAAVPEPDGQPVPTAQVLLDLLSLVEAEIPGPVLTGGEAMTWTREQRLEVAEWAGAIHLAASDHDDVTIPPLPDVLVERLGKPTFWPQSAREAAARAAAAEHAEQAAALTEEIAAEIAEPTPWEGKVTEPCDPEPIVDDPTEIVAYTGLGLERITDVLDELAADSVERGKLLGQATDAVQHAVRTRGDARRSARVAKLDGKDPKSPTDLRLELVGAANDADVLRDLAAVFTAGAEEAKGIAGDLLDELPKRGGKARASAKVGDGEGFELAVTRSRRSELSVKHDVIDDVLAAQTLGEVEAAHRADPESGPLRLGQLPSATYAAGVRAGIAALRYVLSTSPTYRSTALDHLVKRLEDAGEDDLATRLGDAYGKVEKGEASIKLDRKPLPAEKSSDASEGAES